MKSWKIRATAASGATAFTRHERHHRQHSTSPVLDDEWAGHRQIRPGA